MKKFFAGVVVGAAGVLGIGAAEVEGRDPYYMEDEELIGFIEKIVKNAKDILRRRDEE